MADLALSTAVGASAAMTFPIESRRRNYVANATLANGDIVYIVAATGKVDKAGAAAAGKHQCLGIALHAAAAGQAVTVLEQGDYYGFDLSGLNYDAPVYLSDTLGKIGTAAGTASVVVGKVRPIVQMHQTIKSLYVFCAPNIVQA